MSCAALGIDYPLIQAPMAGTATPALAAAVSNAGGLGSISIAAVQAEAGRQMIRETRAATSKPFNINVFCHRLSVADAAREQAWLAHLQPYFAEFGAAAPEAIRDIYCSFQEDEGQLQVLLEERPPIVSFHLGLPPQARIDALKSAGITLLASATTLEEGLLAQDAGIDIIVAQGIEAGGHRGVFDPAHDQGIGTLALVRLLVKHLSRPVIAAGGIMDGAGIAAAMNLGACAAQLGTAFILCPESAANEAYRRMLGSDRARVTQVTTAISGRPARGIVNRFMAEVGAPGHPEVPGFGIAYDAGKQLIAAAAKAGNAEFAAHWAGQGAALARTMPAAELVAVLQREYQAARG
ncbi:nitronate monooxygenase [Pseudomonas sp. URMO17WK12:I1]|uniref:NAD(P)H-dependent flavin oxidoreductase n=1 Tax=unclassified Pseudomonas TaxID=196821 RepID=UPI000482DAFC|nr:MULTISPECIES: nitronate monooxygenase [unclassified Pseudomonas]PZW69571.1 nitronate monooxygenase [Pseudomonas sp. URMO17WK12:I1]